MSDVQNPAADFAALFGGSQNSQFVPAVTPTTVPTPVNIPTVSTPVPPPITAAPVPEAESNPLGWPAWEYALYAPYLPPQVNPAWVPVFAPQQYVSEPANTLSGIAIQPIAITNFPTLTTAQWLQAKYAPKGSVISVPYPGVGGPDQATKGSLPPCYVIVWPNGGMIYASCLAAIWLENPGHQDAADAMCKLLITGSGVK